MTKRLSDYVNSLPPFPNEPKGYVKIARGRNAYVLTTLQGTKVSFDLCGYCSQHVKHCACRRGPTVPRAVEYIWDSDKAHHNGEEWDMSHPDYSGSLTHRENRSTLRLTIVPPTKRPDPQPKQSDAAESRPRRFKRLHKRKRAQV